MSDLLKCTDLLLLFLPIILLYWSLRLLTNRWNKIFLVDFACYKPPPTQSCSKERASELMKLSGYHTKELIDFSMEFMHKIGLSDSTYLPENLLTVPAELSFVAAKKETEAVVFGAIDKLLAKTGVQAQHVGVLVVSCSLFVAVPSLSSMIVRRYKLKDDIANYNLAGMGCSSGLIAISLAHQLLKVRRNTYALVVSTENLTAHYYKGNDRAKFMANCLFRQGGAAILLSNRPSAGKSSKYQLIHTVNSQAAASDQSYKCIFQEEDEEGFLGVNINKDILISAVNVITLHLKFLAPLILPLPETCLVLKTLVMKRIFRAKNPRYVVDFSKFIHHFFPHVGGKPVLDEVQEMLGFSDVRMEASRMTLHRFGNTSSSAVWYSFAYAEAKGRIKKGQLLWQISYGSGFKCISVIWRAVRDVNGDEENPWSQEISIYPVNLDSIEAVTARDFDFEPTK